MRELEHRFPSELLIVGVHSGKYHAERVTARIREAALRLGNTHPIVNDRQFRIWRAYAVRAWPTIALLSPDGRVVGAHAGEFTADQLAPALQRVIDEAVARGTLDPAPRAWSADAPAVAPGTLRYPGKVAVNGRRLAIADSGHHRIIVARLDEEGARARIERVAGSGETGLVDDEDGSAARFTNPQGMRFVGERLVIADAGNHAIREIDLSSGAVRTIAGTGRQLRSRADLDAGALASPWDLEPVGDALYVAMAGVHRIWRVSPATRRSAPFSGSGHEDIVDGPHGEAALAQPMGLALAGERLYFADAESSAIRWADLGEGGRVHTIVGTGLFDFGDEDGVGDSVRMQHQQAVIAHPDGRLLVADSYNDALKWLDPATRRAERWLDGLHEPAGLALATDSARRTVYIADTNAHRVLAIDADGKVPAPREIELEES